MTPEDLAVLYAAAFGATATDGWGAAAFAGFLADPTVFVCVTGDGTSGFVLGRAVAGEAEVLTLCVRPGARRQGQGRALIDAFVDAARQRGAVTAFLEVAEDNHAARGLYAEAGFAECGRRRAYYARAGGTRVDALLLSRALTDSEALHGT